MDSERGRASAYPAVAPPRRKPLLIMGIGAFIFFVIFFTTSSAVVPSSVSQTVAHGAASVSAFSPFHIPSGRFRSASGSQRAHEPPGRLRNSSSGDTSWYSNWDWRHPFSSTVSHDDGRSVLPPLPPRPPIYTYYDGAQDKAEAEKEAERALLLLWRRAWWAQGFKPIILGRAEAMKNPHYETLQALTLQPTVHAELLRWLAWGHMGAGVLANWLVLPMAARDDHDLAFLRRGQYPALTRYEALGSGLFYGPVDAIDKMVSAILASAHATEYKTFLDATAERPDAFAVDAKPPGIAFYDAPALAAHYPSLADTLRSNRAQGLADLARLAAAHLHQAFLAAHQGGLEVIMPHGAGTAALLAAPATALATALNTCPTSPLPGSCPPNAQPQRCAPCAPLPVAFPPAVGNRSDALALVAVPHPYHIALLLRGRPALDVAQVRRASKRDPWLDQVTRELYGDAISAYERIGRLKDEIAGKRPRAALWRTADRVWDWRELEWHFGFALPRKGDAAAGDAAARAKAHVAPESLKVEKPPADAEFDMMAPLLAAVSPKPGRSKLTQQWELLRDADKVLESGKTRGSVNMKEVVEAWHMADAEAWRFVRALEAREKVEREAWEKEEAKVSGSTVRG